MLLPVSAARRLKRSSLCVQPPTSIARPSTISRLPRIEPVSEALTISVSPARRAMKPMISSAALPNVALSRPPSPGPDAVREVLGGLAHQAGERQDGQARDDEDGGRARRA